MKKIATHNAKEKEKDEPETHEAPEGQFPEDQKQAERVAQLCKDVREAFSRNGFAIPGDIDLQIHGMAMLEPHHGLPAEQRLGPGAVAAAA